MNKMQSAKYKVGMGVIQVTLGPARVNSFISMVPWSVYLDVNVDF